MINAYKLGTIPWSNETLEKAYWKNFKDTHESIKQHPGYDLHERILSLKAVLRMFNKTSDSFFTALKQFHIEVHERKLFYRSRGNDLREFEEEFQEILYLFAASAMTLVDQSRAISEKIEIPGYEERKLSTFVNNHRHRFIQELRVDLIHVTLHQPNWQLSTEHDHTHITQFMLHADQFRRSKKWHSLAKKYLREHSNGVDLGALIQEYRMQVNAFQEWLQAAIVEAASVTIDDYHRCDRFLKAIESRCWWRALLSQVVIQGGRDPYQYLDQYLTQSEVEEIQGLPYKSKEQVERIVEMVDDYGAYDEELQSLVYKAFGVAVC
ncbi:MAG TPA: hypothetical protein VIF37_15965 [Methylobacter sp.]|jgi:hypothetical protein